MYMTEIEIKAHVYDPGETERIIASFATFRGESRKSDAYWIQGRPGDGDAATATSTQPVKVRVRDENGALIVTYKRKELRAETEVNDEREFTIDDRDAFEAFIADAGFSPASFKEKRTKRWTWEFADATEVGIELSLVERLGWFVELEVLAEGPDEGDIARIRGILLETLARCGIGEGSIETRYYTEMLDSLDRAGN